MEYRTLGNSDIAVSLIGLGTMTFGEQNSLAEACEQMDYAISRGVNLIDAAEMYPVPPRPETQGSTETQIGEWLRRSGKRAEVILATKVTGRGDLNAGMDHLRGGPRLSREHIRAAIEGSLRRLQTDYVDLYQVHWPERRTNFFGQLGYRHGDSDGIPIEDSLGALQELVAEGKVRRIGLSNETPWGLLEYLRLARENDWPRVVSIQNPYNLLNRSFEIGLAEMAMRERCGLLAYSPLAFGTLSGKYLNGARPEGARLTRYTRFARYSSPWVEEAVAAYVKLAGEAGLAPAQMALAFVNSREFLTSNIIGATTMDQLRVNIDSAALVLDQDLLRQIDALHGRYTIPAP